MITRSGDRLPRSKGVNSHQTGFPREWFTADGNKLVKNATVLLLLAAVFFAMAQYLLSGLEVDSADFPVHLQQGREYSADFQANWNVYYEIRLDSARKLDLQDAKLFAGNRDRRSRTVCTGISPELLLSWWVETGNTIVASGNSDDTNEGYWELKMGKVVGNFPAAKGKTYRVRVRVEKSSSTLQQTNPHINISIKAEDLKWTYVWAGILIQAAAFCFLLMLILLLIFAVHSIKARLNSIDS